MKDTDLIIEYAEEHGILETIKDFLTLIQELQSPENLSRVRQRFIKTLENAEEISVTPEQLKAFMNNMNMPEDHFMPELSDMLTKPVKRPDEEIIQQVLNLPDEYIIASCKATFKTVFGGIQKGIKGLNLTLLKDDLQFYSECIFKISATLAKDIYSSSASEKMLIEIQKVIEDLKILSIDNRVSLFFTAIKESTNYDEHIHILNNAEFEYKYAESELAHMDDVPIAFKYEIERFRDIFSIGKEYLITKKAFPPIVTKLETTPKLSIPQIAVIIALNQAYVNRENAATIVETYGHKSGDSLYNHYCKHNSITKRTSPPPNTTHKTLTNKIELYESVLEHINGKEQERLSNEIAILKGHLTDF